MTANTNISKAISHSMINNTIFWKSETRPFRCIYVTCFNRFRFLAEISSNCKKCTFLGHLRTITQKGNMKTRKMTLVFSSTFSNLTVCDIHFWIWKCSKFIFMWFSLWFILVCKIPQFWAKATNSENPSYFSRK